MKHANIFLLPPKEMCFDMIPLLGPAGLAVPVKWKRFWQEKMESDLNFLMNFLLQPICKGNLLKVIFSCSVSCLYWWHTALIQTSDFCFVFHCLLDILTCSKIKNCYVPVMRQGGWCCPSTAKATLFSITALKATLFSITALRSFEQTSVCCSLWFSLSQQLFCYLNFILNFQGHMTELQYVSIIPTESAMHNTPYVKPLWVTHCSWRLKCSFITQGLPIKHCIDPQL